MSQVLVTGSREASPAMLKKAEQVVLWCFDQGHEVLVGDAPGIDEAVRRACVEHVVAVTVFGAYGRVRQLEIGRFTGRRVLTEGTYPERDVVMAQQCEVCVAIWNGTSRGTKITMDAAARFGKRVITRVFS